jgi:hypothetical protein
VASSGGLEEAVDPRSVRDTVASVAASLPRVPHSTGVVATAPGVVLRVRGRPHRINSGGDGVPPVQRYDLALQIHERAVRGGSRPPFEGAAR